jgi:hypothetical protein
LFGKWNLAYRRPPGRNDSAPRLAVMDKLGQGASSRTVMLADSRPPLPIEGAVSQPHRGAFRRCDRDHIQIEELGLLVSKKNIAAFA